MTSPKGFTPEQLERVRRAQEILAERDNPRKKRKKREAKASNQPASENTDNVLINAQKQQKKLLPFNSPISWEERIAYESRIEEATRKWRAHEKEVLIEAQAREANIEKNVLTQAQDIVSKTRKGCRRNEALTWDILYAFLESETPKENLINRYLDDCDVTTKIRDFDFVVNELGQHIFNTQEKNPLLVRYYQHLQTERNNIISENHLTETTRLAARILFQAKRPTSKNNAKNGINIERGEYEAREMERSSWGKIIGGLALSVLVFTLSVAVSLARTGWGEKKCGNYAGKLFKADTLVKNEADSNKENVNQQKVLKKSLG